MKDCINHKDRAHALLSASSAARWLACPPSAVAAEAYPDQDTEFTREGTLAHEVAEWVVREAVLDEETPAPEGMTTEMLEHADDYTDYIRSLTKSADAVVLVEQRVDFSRWVPDGFGTCDCVILQDDTMIVIDYKYGQGVAVDAKDNPQMRLYALGALNDFGLAFDIQTIEMHIYQPRINNISADTVSVKDLLLWAELVVQPIAADAAKGAGEYEAGAHCKFCPHAGRCLKLTETCTQFVETHDVRVAVPILTAAEVAEVLQLEPLISMWLKRVKEQALTTLLDGGTIPGYKLVEGKQGNRKWTDELQVLNKLTAEGFGRGEVTETKLLSPAAMDKVIGKKRAAELLTEFISRSPGAPTIVVETDNRPEYNRADDFEKLED